MDAVKYWMSELANRSESTKQKYQQFFNAFCEWIGKNPNQILEERKEDLKATDPREQRRYEIKLKEFIAYLEAKGFSTSTQQVAYAAIRSFFETNYMPLNMRRADYPSGEALGYRAATKEDIRKICNKISLRTKTLIFFLKDSGLRVSDITKLKYGHIAKELESGSSFIPINVVTEKNKIVAKTFIGPETTRLLKKYISRRRKGTRKVEPEEITDNSPLFRKRKKPVTISRSGISSLIVHHVKRAGLENEISAHSFRKFFQTQLEAGGINPNWIDQMIGHKLQGVRGHYSRPTDQQLLQAYKGAYNFLRVYPISVTTEEIEGLTKRLEEYKKRTEELMAENEKLKLEIQRLSSRTNGLQMLMEQLTGDKEIPLYEGKIFKELKEKLKKELLKELKE